MNQQDFQRRFNEQMLEMQQKAVYEQPISVSFAAWATRALEFVAIWKSGIKPDTFRELCNKLTKSPAQYYIWEIGTIIQAIRQKGRHDMQLSVDEYCDMHEELQRMSEYIDSVVKPEQERITKSLQREWDVKSELEDDKNKREGKVKPTQGQKVIPINEAVRQTAEAVKEIKGEA